MTHGARVFLEHVQLALAARAQAGEKVTSGEHETIQTTNSNPNPQTQPQTPNPKPDGRVELRLEGSAVAAAGARGACGHGAGVSNV